MWAATQAEWTVAAVLAAVTIAGLATELWRYLTGRGWW